VLARALESEGLATILVTMMPYWAEKIGAPRTLAVEFPFGHTLGQPHDNAQQMRVIQEALSVLESAAKPGEIVDSQEKWPVPTDQAIKDWQPEEPSPIIREMAPRIREWIRLHRNSGS
jgi:D-proline reductase (dithiol) PrdB